MRSDNPVQLSVKKIKIQPFVCILIFVALPWATNAQSRLIAKVKKEYRSLVNMPATIQARLKYAQGKLASDASIFPLIKYPDTLSSASLFYVIESAQPTHVSIPLYLQSGLFDFIEPDPIGYAAGIKHQGNEHAPDPGFSLQWYLHNDGTFTQADAKTDADINMPEAWHITRGDSAIVVAILDTGIDPDHQEFKDRLWSNPQPNKGDKWGWDFINDDNDARDDSGHGTAVAGIIAANADNGISISGIDQKCKLMICKVLDKTLSGYYSQWIAGIYYAVDHGADIINFSLAGEVESQALKEAVEYAASKGVLMVAAMQNFNTGKTYYPAGYAQTIAVGATDPDDKRSRAFNGDPIHGSNYGNHIDLVAPGNYIFTVDYATPDSPGAMWSGTSLATPIVSAVAALLLGQNPSRSPAEIKATLYAAAEDQIGEPHEDIAGWDIFYGYGRINAFKALQLSDNALVEENKVYLFPNPAGAEVNVLLMQELPSPVTISIWNMQGSLVKTSSEKMNNSRVFKRTLPLANLEPGMYVIFIQTAWKSYRQSFLVVR